MKRKGIQPDAQSFLKSLGKSQFQCGVLDNKILIEAQINFRFSFHCQLIFFVSISFLIQGQYTPYIAPKYILQYEDIYRRR